MANYCLPESFFPSIDQVARLSSLGTWSPEEIRIRAAALQGYHYQDLPDSELRKWMIPLFSWDFPQSSLLHTTSLGSLDSEWLDLLSAIYTEPRSLLHLVGATCAHLRVVSITEDCEIELGTLRTNGEFLLIRVAQGKKVKLRQAHLAQGEDTFGIIGSLEAGAQVTFIADYSGLEGSLFGSHERWYLKKGAHLDTHTFMTGIRQSWMRKEFILAEGSDLAVTWLGVLKDTEEAALTTVQHHRGSSSTSSVEVKSVLSQEARSFYRGTITIENQARLSSAQQQQRALLISPQARACAIPSLEVAAHEVSCQHGSAAGKLNPQEIQYLRQRGLDEKQAQYLIIEGFLQGNFLEQHSFERLRKQICL